MWLGMKIGTCVRVRVRTKKRFQYFRKEFKTFNSNTVAHTATSNTAVILTATALRATIQTETAATIPTETAATIPTETAATIPTETEAKVNF